ncbi:MAG: 23S rRNA (guanosine(2251)-2'-O)-methyltransferase RlmB [Alphaproteobacteria bacterium]|nr:23S rRNA (guanosine(2251)-2'-O)-methyltransferase RlmB [Alphaproteobacteria bacterium]
MPRRSFSATFRNPAAAGRNTPAGGDWLYGRHTVLAALKNPARRLGRMYWTEAIAADQELATAATARQLFPTVVTPAELARWLPPSAVHQGVALQAAALPQPHLADFLDDLPAEQGGTLLLLDQVVDPQNLGSLLRSAAAFGALAVVMPHDRSPPLSGSMAKAASGALELVPIITVANLGQAMTRAKDAGFWCVGLDEGGQKTLDQVDLGNRIALVLGAEGAGLRRLTRDHCDLIAQLPTNPAFPTLNAAVAGAIALYQLRLSQARLSSPAKFG